MFVFKIGKVKHKFKLKFTIVKYKYSPQQEIQKNALFKVKITRGSHQIQAYSLPVKKGSIKFPKTQYTIPMTLFYDQSDHIYLQKEIEVKSYFCDENANILRTIGKTTLNIAEYANKNKFGLQIQIDGQNKKNKEQAKITFQMNLQRQDDDSKSVDTISQDDLQIRSKQLKRKQKQRKSKSKQKQKNNFLFPIAQSKVSVKSAQQKLKHSTISQMDQKYSQQINDKKKPISPIKYLQEVKKNSKKGQSDDENYDAFFEKFQNKYNSISLKNDKKMQNQLNQQKNNLQKKQQKKKQQIQIEFNKQKKQRDTEHSQLEVHMTNKKVLLLEKQNNQLKIESTRLKQIIEKLLQQKNTKEVNQSSSNNQSRQQMEYYKKIIVQKQIKINELESLNKIILEREQQKERQIKLNRNQIKQLRMRLQHQKNKLAKVLQTAMQSENLQLVQMIEKELNDQFY